ncbi:glycosyltransferase family A protein, partial [Candidatus Pelagibacter sp.]|nr:glycosyltransferase family A protein [Candidatus Pelagibacter sp.]
MKQKLVSIIMNCHNGEKYLKQAIHSILIQSYKNWELVFFDNASTDNSSNIVKNFKDKRIKYYYSKYVNLGIARKKAYQLCKGEYISFLDCDDYWEKNKLRLQIDQLKKNPKSGLSFSNSFFFKNNKKKLLYDIKPHDGYIFEKLLEKYFISFDTVIIKRFYLNKLKHVFDEKFTIA